ncbi:MULTISPECIES: RIP metalloprotease RseP [Flavobacteriaceae]|uniref:Zinc metalloprotease n=2 Tax=Flavobacteriaceae TaxID=49546 RepID=A0A4Y8APS9_9FLAO|nr:MULTISPECIES: RIP metalloprotease RseP [Flavobacteriaceae]TEW72612.1 RIP metalloprotease RseP [Gramella jeungdoensis]GGK54321.1 zinc metalloprotease [Lutibacter litoralis]
MEILIKASQFILSLSFLIVLHELGHFIPAKIFKTRVEKFYLFFDYKFSLFKKKIGDTVYGIGWIPLGGYVKISGMIDESMDTEHLNKPAEPWEFRSKPAWQRLIIMLGGVTVNFILGIVIYIMITFVWGIDFVKPEGVKNGFAVHETFKEYGFKDGDIITKFNGVAPLDVTDVNKHLFLRDITSLDVIHEDGKTATIAIPEDIGSIMWEKGVMEPFKIRTNPVIDTVIVGSPADISGILKNDRIISINNTPVVFWQDFSEIAANSTEDKLIVEVERNGVSNTISIVPNEDRTIGVSNYRQSGIDVQHKDFSFLESISKGNSLAIWTLKDYITQFKYVFTKKGATSIGGFIAIGNIFPATWSWQSFWSITAFLSIMLGFMNLLPIPALDGGHVVFTLYEMITGRKPNDKFLEYAQITGFLILIALLLLANGNDIVKLFSN